MFERIQAARAAAGAAAVELHVQEASALVAREALERVTVAYVDTGLDRKRLKTLRLRARCVDGRGHEADADPVGHGTLFAHVLSHYCTVRDAYGPSLLAVRAGDTAQPRVADVAAAIRRAADLGADVLSVNLCNSCFSSEIAAAVQHAARSGTVVVSPAGNLVTDVYTYPASLRAVVGTTSFAGGVVPAGANVNDRIVVCAPEHDVRELVGAAAPGTSFSVPVVAAALAFMRAANPGLRVEQARAIFRRMSDGVTVPLRGKQIRIGRLDFLEAVRLAREPGDATDSAAEALHFRIAGSHEHEPNVFVAEVCDERGEPSTGPSGEVELAIHPFRPLDGTPNGTPIERARAALVAGRVSWSFRHLERGTYFLRLVDLGGAVTDSLSTIVRA